MTVRLLLTGFEPFGGSSLNPSEQVVSVLAEQPPPGIELSTAILPVDWQRAPQVLLHSIREESPQAVLCLGEASRRSVLSIERLAVNVLDFRISDNQGVQVIDEPVCPDGPAAYFVTLPVRKLLEAVRAAHVPVELSLSAGSFLCNQVLYVLLDFLDRQHLQTPAGFIHLPPLPEQVSAKNYASPSMSIETSLRGIRAAIEALRILISESKSD